jgi:hypothetical protein
MTVSTSVPLTFAQLAQLGTAVRVHQPCTVQRYHWPPVQLGETEEHHVQPLYLGGPDIRANKRWVCPNCHYAAHLALTAMVAGKPVPRVTRAQLALAKDGWNAWVASGQPITGPKEHVAWLARLAA